MAITKVTSGLISADASSIDLNIDAGTLYLDVSENRVGIGTTSPDTLLELFADNPVLRLRDSKVKGSSWAAGDALGGLEFYTSDTTGIGTHTVASIKVVNGGEAVQSPDGEIVFSTGAYDTAASEVMRIDSSGNVGIGTVSPSEPLHVQEGGSSGITSKAGTILLVDGSANTKLSIASGTTSTGELLFGRSTDNDAGRVIYDHSANNMSFYANGSEAMRIDSSGNVLVGTTSADAKMVVKGSGTGTAYTFRTSDSSGNFRLAVRDDGLLNTGTGSASPYNLTTGSAANMHVLSNGTIYRSTSSLRYKNTITDASHGLTELLTLRPVTYKGNNDGDTIFGGLIAEEVHDAGLTEFVQYNDENQPDALAYGNMVSLCIKAIQELSDKVDNQQTIIDNLTTRIETLENS